MCVWKIQGNARLERNCVSRVQKRFQQTKIMFGLLHQNWVSLQNVDLANARICSFCVYRTEFHFLELNLNVFFHLYPYSLQFHHFFFSLTLILCVSIKFFLPLHRSCIKMVFPHLCTNSYCGLLYKNDVLKKKQLFNINN